MDHVPEDRPWRSAGALEAVALLAIIGLATWLRLAGLDRTSLFGDEAVYSGQAAALAGDAARADSFGIFLAHPVLFQLILGAGFLAGLPDEGGRILTALFGVGTVGLGWLIARYIGGRALGLATGLLLAVLAYDVYLSRLVLLDGPAAFAVAGSLYAFLRAARERSGTWLAISAGVLGLAVLTKESAVLILPAVGVAAVVEPRLRLGTRAWLFAAATFMVVVAAFLLSIVVGGGIDSTLTYLHYQLSRHDQSAFLTYVRLVGPYFGWPFVAGAVIGFVVAVRAGGDRRIVAIWAIVPTVILQAWGLRELQLPMLVVVQVTLLAAFGLEAVARGVSAVLVRFGAGVARRAEFVAGIGLGLVVAVALTIVPLSLRATSLPDGQPTRSGLREASLWLRDHAGPTDGAFVSTAYKSSVVAYYSRRPAYGFIPVRRHDPMYRDPGDVAAFWRAGGVRWVVLDHQSRSQATNAATGVAAYDRLVHLLDSGGSALVYEVPGRTPDAWLAQVHSVTVDPGTQPTAQAPTVIGHGDGRIVALSYAFCFVIACFIVLIGRRTTRRPPA